VCVCVCLAQTARAHTHTHHTPRATEGAQMAYKERKGKRTEGETKYRVI
jgi:hypothetical protein